MSFARGPGKRESHWWKKLPNHGGALSTHVGNEPFGASVIGFASACLSKGSPTAERTSRPCPLVEYCRILRGLVLCSA
jgi:hypothetical protein